MHRIWFPKPTVTMPVPELLKSRRVAEKGRVPEKLKLIVEGNL